MQRRKFLQTLAPAIVLPSLLQGLTIRAYSATPFIQELSALQTDTDRVLVLIQLNGGNDGLNTVIPLDQYENLQAARGNVLATEDSVLPLSGTTATGLHPAMEGMRQLYEEGKLSIIQGVGYPNFSFSHFRATDIYATGSSGIENLETGWIGRYLEHEFNGFPAGFPNPEMPDPPAIQLGLGIPLLFQAAATNMAMTISGPNVFNNWVNGGGSGLPSTPAGIELAYLRTIAQQTQSYASQIIAASEAVTSQNPNYPEAGVNELSDQLKLVARLIAGGLKTRIYLVSIGGFDTHSNQIGGGSSNTGTHATLLGKVSDAIKAFTDDLTFLNIEDRVLGMTFTEFGRRVKANASAGTDHGTCYPMFVFGTNLQPGMVGVNPVIPASVGVNFNLPTQHDYRAVYGTLLKDWFCLPQTIANDIMLHNFTALPIVNAPCCISPQPVITGPVTVCPENIAVYSIPEIAGSTYIWTVTGGTILSGQGTNTIQVQWENNQAGNVQVSQIQ
ncbi:MAG: DUF1501 domain-containing protein [Sphingobacteriales bacterium]|nr:MAG: DUF1501 domain-containing protein [Sphingobacteriales bacterium]